MKQKPSRAPFSYILIHQKIRMHSCFYLVSLNWYEAGFPIDLYKWYTSSCFKRKLSIHLVRKQYTCILVNETFWFGHHFSVQLKFALYEAYENVRVIVRLPPPPSINKWYINFFKFSCEVILYCGSNYLCWYFILEFD